MDSTTTILYDKDFDFQGNKTAMLVDMCGKTKCDTYMSNLGSSAYVQIEKFRDDIVARYDILLSEDLGKNKLLYYTQEEFEKADRYLAQQMGYINAKSYVLLNLKDNHGKAFGSILCISTDNEQINLLAVRELSIELENIFNNGGIE